MFQSYVSMLPRITLLFSYLIPHCNAISFSSAQTSRGTFYLNPLAFYFRIPFPLNFCPNAALSKLHCDSNSAIHSPNPGGLTCSRRQRAFAKYTPTYCTLHKLSVRHNCNRIRDTVYSNLWIAMNIVTPFQNLITRLKTGHRYVVRQCRIICTISKH